MLQSRPALQDDIGYMELGRRGAELLFQASNESFSGWTKTLLTLGCVIVRDELSALPAVLRLARRARRVVTANLIIAGPD